MYRVILVDDEPLILAGISSLIAWEDYDCTIVGKATNGPSAYDMILKEQPDIVITDIRMPVLNGLELVEKCQSSGCSFAFLVLTNLEEFHLVKKALALGASDYLVKIELSEEALAASLERAKNACDLLVKRQQHQQLDHLIKNNSEDLLHEYLTQLLLLPNTPSLISPPEELVKQYHDPFLALFALRPDNITFHSEEILNLRQLNKQILDIIGGIVSRYYKVYTLLEYKEGVYILIASLNPEDDFRNVLINCDNKINTALKTYFELTAVFGISTRVHDLSDLPAALAEAQTALDYYYYDSADPTVFYQGQSYHHSEAKNFNINFLKKDLSASILQNDGEKLRSIFSQIIDLFAECKPSKEHATSACINIYTYLYSFFENEGGNYQDIFPYTINIAGQLNHFNSLADILEWLQSFCNNLCRLLTDRRETRSDRLIDQAKRYVNEHYTEKLALADISDALNISSGHLSNTFKKLTGITLSDYIAEVKIGHAKELIDTHQYLMYQISDMLGFDNPYYFSKVFKKITGISPREHENHTQSDRTR